MSSFIIEILSSPFLLYTTSAISFIVARYLTNHVLTKGPLSIAPYLIKYNSRVYSMASFLLFLAILSSFGTEIAETPDVSLNTIICSQSTIKQDEIIRYLFHFSKFYEYVDIFNVLGAGGEVNAHFGIHHFTTPYLTYARVIKHPAGWKIFAVLNTFHHALMYAYFGGAAAFSEIIVYTGCLQLGVGIFIETYEILRNWEGGNKDCGGSDALWANVLAAVLLSTYALLFSGDLRARGKTGRDQKNK